MSQELRGNHSHYGEPVSNKCVEYAVHVYCGRECLIRDRSKQEIVWEQFELERAIIRTADTLQKAYFAFREPLFERSIVKIEERVDELVLYQKDADLVKKKGWFVDFPNCLVKDELTKKAVLCVLMDREPLAYLLDIIHYLLDDLAVKVEEVQVRLKNVPRKTTVIYSNGVQQSNYPGNHHFLLRVTSTESDKVWIIDITGAQYGLVKHLWRWEDFLQRHVQVVEEISKLGTSWDLLTTSSVVPGMPSLDLGIPRCAMDRVNLAIQAWEVIELDRKIFVLLHDENYNGAQTNMIKVIQQTTRDFVNQSDYSRQVRDALEYEKQNPNASMKMIREIHTALFIKAHSEPVSKHCSNCTKPATMKCSQCNLHVYCDAKCQKAHWPKHKKTCRIKDLDRVMRRAGAILQNLYLMLCEATFKNKVIKVEDSGRHLTIHTKDTMIKSNKFATFPDHMFKNKKDKMMFLCASRCSDFVGYFKEIIEMMFKGSDVYVDEINIKMKPPDRSVILMTEGQFSSDGGHNSHYLIQVTKHQPFHQWIFDVTGPQLNVFDPCLDLPTYTTKYIDRYRMTAPFGTARILFENLVKMKGLESLEPRINWDAAKAVERGIQEWQTGTASNLPDLLRQPESVFKKAERSLLTTVERSLIRFVAAADYASVISLATRHTRKNLSTVAAETKAVFIRHEEYLAQFKD